MNDLVDAVRSVADCPCPEHNDLFVAAVHKATEIILMLVATDRSEVGTRTVAAGEKTTVATSTVRGQQFLHAHASLDAAQRRFPGATFVGVGRDAAFAMACSGDLSGLLVTADDETDAWGVVTCEGLRGP